MTVPWAKREDPTSDDVFKAVHAGLTVHLIETPRVKLVTCQADERVPLVVSRNIGHFDHIPVVDAGRSGHPIVGLFHAAAFFDRPAPDQPVGALMMPLAEEHLLGADASILDFLKDADARPCCLVLAGAEISGLVTLSDLQKLPVRATLFALITGFEITMAEAIRRRFPADEDWLALLSPPRRRKIEEKVAAGRQNNAFVDRLLYTEFADKKTIVGKGLDLGYSRAALDRELRRIQALRDHLAHANDYAATPDEARNVCGTVRSLHDVHKLILKTLQ